jgi:hypothetical protein
MRAPLLARAITFLSLFTAIDAAFSSSCVPQSRREYFESAESIFRAVIVRSEPDVYKEGLDGFWYLATPVRYRLLERFKGTPLEQGVIYSDAAFFMGVRLDVTDELVIYASTSNYAISCSTFSVSRLGSNLEPKPDEILPVIKELREWANELSAEQPKLKLPVCRTRPAGNSKVPYISLLHPNTEPTPRAIGWSPTSTGLKIMKPIACR